MWYLTNIPKIAHFYWGNDTISYLRYLTVYSFKKFNPDWEVRLYQPVIKYQGGKTWGSPEHSAKYNGLNYLANLLNLDVKKVEVDFTNYGMSNQMPESFKADFLRWYLLATVGGLWSDMDIIYYRPISELYLNHPSNQPLNTLVCMQENTFDNYHAIGFLLGSAANPYYKFINSKTYSMLNLGDYQSIGSKIPNYYFGTLPRIRERFPYLAVGNLSLDVVYPINYTMVPYIFNTPYIHYLKEITMGLHWFAGHPEALIFENLINHDSHLGYNNVVAQVVRMVI